MGWTFVPLMCYTNAKRVKSKLNQLSQFAPMFAYPLMCITVDVHHR